MQLENMPFAVTDWELVAVTEHAGETGVAYWKTLELIRFV